MKINRTSNLQKVLIELSREGSFRKKNLIEKKPTKEEVKLIAKLVKQFGLDGFLKMFNEIIK